MKKLRERLGEIVASLNTLNSVEDLTVEQIEEVNALTTEANEINAKIEAKENMNNVISLGNKTEAKTVTKTVATAGTPRKMENGSHGS